jgi:hypothetical protein
MPLMIDYLVAYAVTYSSGQHLTRTFKQLPHGEIVTRKIIERWENEEKHFWLDFRELSIQVLSFQVINQ